MITGFVPLVISVLCDWLKTTEIMVEKGREVLLTAAFSESERLRVLL